MVPLTTLQGLVERRKKTGLFSQVVHEQIQISIPRKGHKGIPVSVKIGDSSSETRWFDEVPSAKDLEEIVTFLVGRIVTKGVHES